MHLYHLYFNELSIHEQFSDEDSFMEAVKCLSDEVEDIKNIREKDGHIDCRFRTNKKWSMRCPMPDKSMQDVCRYFIERNKEGDKDKASKIRVLFNKHEYQESQHDDDDRDRMECEDKQKEVHDVMNAGIGDAARHRPGGDTISFAPSNWDHSPLRVQWKRKGTDTVIVTIKNWLAGDTGLKDTGLKSKLEKMNLDAKYGKVADSTKLSDGPVRLKFSKDLKPLSKKAGKSSNPFPKKPPK